MDQAKRNVAVLSLSQALLMSGQVLFLASAGLVGKELSPVASLATLPAALQFLSSTATTFPAAQLMQRAGRRVGFVGGAMVGALAGILAAYAITQQSFGVFLAASVLAGVYSGFGGYYRFAAADAADEAYRSRAISLVLAGGVAAAFVGSNLAEWTRELVSGAAFSGSYLAYGVLALIAAAVLVFVLLPRPTATERRGGGRALLSIARQADYAVAVLVAMAGYGVMVFLMTATPLAMRAEAYSFGSVAFVIQWHVVGMFAPSFVTGSIVRRLGTMAVMALGGVLMLGTVVGNLMGTSIWHYWAALLLLGVGWNFTFIGATTHLTGTYQPEEKAKAQGFNELLVYAGVTVASLSAGAVHETLGWRSVNVAALPFVLVLLASVLWLWWRSHGRVGSPA